MGPQGCKNSGVAGRTGAEPTLRFAILRHEGPGNGENSVHWDLLLEVPGQELLAAWRVDADPATWGEVEHFGLEKINDHRRIYLEYEGEISGNRGHVVRVDEGELAWTKEGRAMLHGRMGARMVELGENRGRVIRDS